MPIMHKNGMSVEVPNARVNDFLGRGYRMQPPSRKSSETKRAEESQQSTNDLVKINSAPLKELLETFKLSTPQAKELRDGRPYKTIEDLIAKLSDVDWAAFKSKVSFE